MKLMRRVYFDNNASTPVLSEVFDAMRPYFGEHFGNASSIHHHGQDTRAAVERARESLATLVGCRPSEIVFTSGGTEGDNLAIFGLAASANTVISSPTKNPPVLMPSSHLEGLEVEVTFFQVEGGERVDPPKAGRRLGRTTG